MANPKLAAAPYRANTLIGLPTAPPKGLPPLRAVRSASHEPAAQPLQGELRPAPTKREPSLVILSRQLLNTARRPARMGRLRPPAPPPTSHGIARRNPSKRASADVTDYYMPIVSPYATTPLQAASTLSDSTWAADLEQMTHRKARARTLWLGLSVAIVCSLAFLVCRV